MFSCSTIVNEATKNPFEILRAPPRIPPARDHGTEAFNLNLLTSVIR